ncbi:MAG: hypothetical protein KGJ78_13120 [Alphaproteobacteria bacterium]|nr:hypothetical protein [Alphaproteobacteria bacterium]
MTDDKYEAVIQDVRNLKNDTAALAGRLEGRAEGAVRSLLDRIQHSASNIWDAMARQGTDSIEVVQRKVGDRPWTSLFFAFMAGCLFGQVYRKWP